MFGNKAAAEKVYNDSEGIPIRISQLLHHLIETNANLDLFAQTTYVEKSILGLSLNTLMTPQN